MKQDCSSILKELPYLLENLFYDISILSNASALLNMHLQQINWVGFYILKENQLLLGPFQGKVACSVIPLNKGVCGTCASQDKPIIVENVHTFKGHIACDSASQSEICIPIHSQGKLYGLLDIDSPYINRFTEWDKQNLIQVVTIIEKALFLAKNN